MKKIISLLLAVLTAFSVVPVFTVFGSAANVCTEISAKSGENGGRTTTFYAEAKNKKTHFIKISGTKGELTGDAAVLVTQNKKVYDYLTVKVYGQKNGRWVKLSDANYKNKSSIKITFSGYYKYKFEVHSWKTSTIEKSAVYWPHPITREPWSASSVYWKVQPSWRVSKTSGMTDCDALYKNI